MIMLDRGGAPGTGAPRMSNEPSVVPISADNAMDKGMGPADQEIRIEDIPF